ncbi:hypothetical protein GE09DRAFT_583649 [Coniochaeta sp. 2T2.1]|nr:hypothetical protein GE09DRAFT_583649 [Coniochaeta sp. 2T2.1]
MSRLPKIRVVGGFVSHQSVVDRDVGDSLRSVTRDVMWRCGSYQSDGHCRPHNLSHYWPALASVCPVWFSVLEEARSSRVPSLAETSRSARSLSSGTSASISRSLAATSGSSCLGVFAVTANEQVNPKKLGSQGVKETGGCMGETCCFAVERNCTVSIFRTRRSDAQQEERRGQSSINDKIRETRLDIKEACYPRAVSSKLDPSSDSE